jgi:hypothetical protein
VIEACARHRPELRHHLFTSVPRGFITQTLVDVDFVVHELRCDVGMVQRTPFDEDIDATVRAVADLPLEAGPALDRVVAELESTGCRLVVSDIAPLGIVAARRCGVPGALIANFTWDWIYRGYGDARLARAADRLAEIFASADLTIAAEPDCPMASVDRCVAPISRRPHRDRTEVRNELGLADEDPVVLVSVSGLDAAVPDDIELPAPDDAIVMVAGTSGGLVRRRGRIGIPAEGGPYHPDLVAASDLVIGKLGYSTVAEVHHSGAGLAYLSRPRFPESPVLEAFVRDRLVAARVPEDWWRRPETERVLQRLLSSPRRRGSRPNGADEAAVLLLDLL